MPYPFLCPYPYDGPYLHLYLSIYALSYFWVLFWGWLRLSAVQSLKSHSSALAGTKALRQWTATLFRRDTWRTIDRRRGLEGCDVQITYPVLSRSDSDALLVK